MRGTLPVPHRRQRFRRMSFLSRLFGKNPLPTKPVAGAAHRSATWPFDQAPSAAAITTHPVLEGKEEIHVVVHYSDDHSWAFLCGTTDDQADGRVVRMADIVALDETVNSIADLPPGWKAWRPSRGGAWERAENFERG